MKVAILLRGNTFVEKDRYGFPMDARDNVASLLENFILPIRALYPEAKLYLATYDSPILADLTTQFEPCEPIILEAEDSSQIETFKVALKHIFETNDFDALIATRFDLAFRKSFSDWNLDIDDSTIYFPWKESLIGWRDHQRVGDAVHVIGRRVTNDFYSALIMNQLARRRDIHLLYYFLRLMTGNIRFIEPGYWDSNTLFANPECDNPLYRIFHRPKLADMAPHLGLMPREVKGE